MNSKPKNMKTLQLVALGLLISTLTFGVEKVEVKNTEEFIQALGSNKHIILESGTYDITFTKELGALSSHYKEPANSWEDIEITGLENVTFEGKGEVSVIITNPSLWVVNFTNCKNLVFKNLEFGHKVDGECSGGAALFQNSQNIQLFNVGLYGCGTTGLELRNVSQFSMEASRVYKCTLYLANFRNSNTIAISNTTFENSGMLDMFTFNNNKNVSFTHCTIQNNTEREHHFEPIYFVYVVSAESPILFKGCVFENNDYKTFSNSLESLQLKSCEFNDNTFDSDELQQKTKIKKKENTEYMMGN